MAGSNSPEHLYNVKYLKQGIVQIARGHGLQIHQIHEHLTTSLRFMHV